MYFSKEDVQSVLNRLAFNCGFKAGSKVYGKASLTLDINNSYKFIITYPVKVNNVWSYIEFKLAQVQAYNQNGLNTLKIDPNSKYSFNIRCCNNIDGLYSLILQEVIKYRHIWGF